MPDHYYTQDGQPMHFIDRADGQGSRPTTLRDAKKLGLLPSVTTILKAINKPQLERWKMIQAVTAVLTSPRKADEGLDQFMDRVLFQDKEQDEEAAAAADLGGWIHAALESMFAGRQIDDSLLPWIQPVYEHVKALCPVVLYTETVLVGDGYAGKTDFIGLLAKTSIPTELIVDFKTTKSKLPDKSYIEARLQLSAYAMARQEETQAVISTANCYISTVNRGEFSFHVNPDWPSDFDLGFRPILEYWFWANSYRPEQDRVCTLASNKNAS